MTVPRRFLAAAVLTSAAMLAAPLTAATADSTSLSVDQKCRVPYKHDRQRLNRFMEGEQSYYDAHEQSVVSLIQQMSNLLSDPDLHYLIPQQESATAQFRTATQAIVARQRDAVKAEIKDFNRMYTKCVHTKADRNALAAGTSQVRSAFRDLFTANERLMMSTGALATSADVGTAEQNLQEARTEVLAVGDQFERGMRKLRSLQ